MKDSTVRTIETSNLTRPQAVRGSLLGLQRAAGNRAVSVLVARAPTAAAPVTGVSPELVARMKKVRGQLGDLGSICSAGAAEVGAASDQAVRVLKLAEAHLGRSQANYEEAHGRFTRVLERADALHTADQAFYDMLQGLVIAGIVSVVAPDALAAKAALHLANKNIYTSLVARKITSSLVGTRGKFAEGAAGGGMENLAGLAVSPVTGEMLNSGTTPSSTTRVIDTPESRLREAREQLSQMIGFLPEGGGLTYALGALSTAAETMKGQSLLVQLNDPDEAARFTAEEIEAATSSMQELKATGMQQVPRVKELSAKLVNVANRVMSKPVESVPRIEERLWTSWIASLQFDSTTDPRTRRLLGNEEIYKYLGPEGKQVVDRSS